MHDEVLSMMIQQIMSQKPSLVHPQPMEIFLMGMLSLSHHQPLLQNMSYSSMALCPPPPCITLLLGLNQMWNQAQLIMVTVMHKAWRTSQVMFSVFHLLQKAIKIHLSLQLQILSTDPQRHYLEVHRLSLLTSVLTARAALPYTQREIVLLVIVHGM